MEPSESAGEASVTVRDPAPGLLGSAGGSDRTDSDGLAPHIAENERLWAAWERTPKWRRRRRQALAAEACFEHSIARGLAMARWAR